MLSTDDCRSAPSADKLTTDTLNIVLPVYNEVDTIESVLKEWITHLGPLDLDYHFVICEDGSTDGTKELLGSLKTRYPLVLSQRKERRGYGGAVIDGVQMANAIYILCVDSDGQCDPQDFHAFWKVRDTCDVVIGWRVNRADNSQRKVFSMLFKTVFRVLFKTPIHDPSAPYVLFKKATIHPHVRYLRYLKEGFWWGFVGMCVKVGLSIKEIPINHRLRVKGDTQVYHLKKIPSIAIRNFIGLFRLRLAS